MGIDYCGMAADQRDDPEVQALRTATSSLQVEDIPFGVQGVTHLCDTTTPYILLVAVACLVRSV